MSINRKSLVQRHNPELKGTDITSPLSIGNGNFAYTCDVTGFQTFRPENEDDFPLCCMSQWGMHSYPGYQDRGPGYEKLRKTAFAAGPRSVSYMDDRSGQEELFDGLRTSPHRANLMELSLAQGSETQLRKATRSEITQASQKLDLFSGLLSSSFVFNERAFEVKSCCHPERDELLFSITSQSCKLLLAFPYPSHEIHGSDWGKAGAHQSELQFTDEATGNCRIRRKIDGFEYDVTLCFSQPVQVTELQNHQFLLSFHEGTTDFSIAFTEVGRGHGAQAGQSARSAAESHWADFWTNSAAIDFSGSSDPLAHELERRIVLSRYLLAIQCSGNLPPQETGLTCNSWYGKFHLEMHPLHALQFACWNQPELLERSMQYYADVADTARLRAREQGYAGLRFPKMTDASGLDSPSPIGVFLCWQQPHILFMLELLRLSGACPDIEKRFIDVVCDTAEFMADYPVFNEQSGFYDLASPLIPVQENHPPEDTANPVFELQYWKLGLDIATSWMQRAGRQVPEAWTRVRGNMAPPPVDESLSAYKAQEHCDDSYGRYATDHPSFLMAFGYIRGEDIDPQLMETSLNLVLKNWKFNSSWGWDFPVMAMCAARLGRKVDAVRLLLMHADKNSYLPNGHNKQTGSPDLPLYLPGNGSLLLAVALMAGGWKGCEDMAPAFPDDGSWKWEIEGFKQWPF